MRIQLLNHVVLFTMLLAPPLTAFAQNDEEMEEIVVTGSLIKGTPIDAGLPVEIYTASDLLDMGAPTALEFVKGLTASGPTAGEAYYFGGNAETGHVSYNLRGLGSDKTLTLWNGRRPATQNASIIPGPALARIEILKDGSAVTYGADATGGVINYITRDSYEGFMMTSSYKYFGSDGDWNIGMLGGFGSENTNVMIAAEWDHRSEFDAKERDFTTLPYGVNPSPWSTLTNLAGWIPRGSLPDEPGVGANAEWGSPLAVPQSDYTRESCEAVGGIYRDSYTCKYNYIPYYNIVQENEIYKLYFQVTSTVTDNINFHLNVLSGRNFSPHNYGSPAQPVTKGPSRGSGATYQFYVPKANPNVAEFAARSGWDQNPYYAYAQGYTPITYRIAAHGGNTAWAEGGNYSTPAMSDRRYLHVSTGIDGTFSLLEREIGYDVAITYNQLHNKWANPDAVGYRVQEAMSGFGGPNCDVPDLDPVRFGTQNAALAGTGGCMWWNPFASGWAGQPVLGLANPSYVPGSENSNELIRWVMNPRKAEDLNYNYTFDLVFNGVSPLELPGGPVAWGAGYQFRALKTREVVEDPLYNGSQPCAWPEQMPLDPEDAAFTGCTPDAPGPFVFFATDIPEINERQQWAYFGEVNLPILETLYLTAAARYEEFGGELDATVYKVSGKWDVTDNLALRGSYGTNFQAPGLGIQPGEINAGTISYSIAGGDWRGQTTVTQTGIVPETATVWSVGIIWQSQGFTADSELELILDYFDIETEDELSLLATAGQTADSIFSIAPDGGTDVPDDGTALADCSHPLIGRVTFNDGTCVQGTTTAEDFSSVRRDYGNGPGQLTAGYDLQLTYGFPVFTGDLTIKLIATKMTKFEFTETSLDGFVLDPGEDRLGFLNFATIAQTMSELRANLSANYRQGNHNLRFVLAFVKGVEDERGPLTPRGMVPGTEDSFGPTNYGLGEDDWITASLHYNVDLPWATVSASISNITDEDPPEAREELGYDPYIGNPLGRVFQVSIRKEF